MYGHIDPSTTKSTTKMMSATTSISKTEISRIICVWREEISRRPNIDIDRISEMGISPNESMIWLDTTIMTCNACRHELELDQISAKELTRMEMDIYKAMIERTVAIASSIWCTNDNVYSNIWGFDPKNMQKPEKIITGNNRDKNMNLRICTDKHIGASVIPSIIGYRKGVVGRPTTHESGGRRRGAGF